MPLKGLAAELYQRPVGTVSLLAPGLFLVSCMDVSETPSVSVSSRQGAVSLHTRRYELTIVFLCTTFECKGHEVYGIGSLAVLQVTAPRARFRRQL
jgi:hypothetical protein